MKFSANVEDALHNLLVKRNPAYLEPVEAFADAFDDLRDHQMAMLAGMRVAFEAMLADFDPDRLEEQFDRRFRKARCWRAGEAALLGFVSREDAPTAPGRRRRHSASGSVRSSSRRMRSSWSAWKTERQQRNP